MIIESVNGQHYVGLNCLQSLQADFSLNFYGRVMRLAVDIFIPLGKQSQTDHQICYTIAASKIMLLLR